MSVFLLFTLKKNYIMSTNLEIGLVKRLCITCTSEVDAEIIMNTKLTKKEATKIKELHGKVIGFTDEPCDECKELTKQGLLIIGYDEDKSDLDNLPEGFYRTGNMFVIKSDCDLANHIYDVVPKSKELGFVFMDNKVLNQLGVIDKK